MTSYVGLLRAVNLGPGSTLAMADLKRLCEAAGFERVRTYIASGNVVFESEKPEAAVKSALERQLEAHAGKSLPAMVRTASDMAAIVEAFPFDGVPGNRAVVIFLDEKPPKDALAAVSGQADDERAALGKREIFVAYGSAGIGRSKLKIPAAARGTARNLNTVKKLAEMARA